METIWARKFMIKKKKKKKKRAKKDWDQVQQGPLQFAGGFWWNNKENSKFWIEMGPSISISILGPHLVQILWSSTKLNYNSIKHHYGYRAKKSTTNLPFGLQRAKCISGDRGEGESGTLAIYDFFFDRVLRRSAILCALMAFFLFSFFFWVAQAFCPCSYMCIVPRCTLYPHQSPPSLPRKSSISPFIDVLTAGEITFMIWYLLCRKKKIKFI